MGLFKSSCLNLTRYAAKWTGNKLQCQNNNWFELSDLKIDRGKPALDWIKTTQKTHVNIFSDVSQYNWKLPPNGSRSPLKVKLKADSNLALPKTYTYINFLKVFDTTFLQFDFQMTLNLKWSILTNLGFGISDLKNLCIPWSSYCLICCAEKYNG